jgi:hypothetical protein
VRRSSFIEVGEVGEVGEAGGAAASAGGGAAASAGGGAGGGAGVGALLFAVRSVSIASAAGVLARFLHPWLIPGYTYHMYLCHTHHMHFIST